MLCKGCGLEKDHSLFYQSNRSKCKECVKSGVRANREANVEYYREYDRKRSMREDRVEARKEYLKTEKGRQVKTETIKRYIEKNPKKRAVHIRTGNAIRDGILVKGCCQECGTTDTIVAHHCDYDKPLDVMWLCAKHHTEWHAEHGEALNAS